MIYGERLMKNRIVDAAVELANEMGTHRVTTNHIIERLGISPGTFYYHFKNKEEIIRKIFERITAEFDGLFSGNIATYNMAVYAEIIKYIYLLYYKYRSFYYDISMLLDRDEVLEKSYRENYIYKSEKLRSLTILLEENGVMRKFRSDMEREVYLENLWIISDYRLTFLKSAGNVKPDELIDKGVISYFMYISPYLADSAKSEILEILKL